MCSTASACNNPSDSITEIVRLGQLDYYNKKQNEVLWLYVKLRLCDGKDCYDLFIYYVY